MQKIVSSFYSSLARNFFLSFFLVVAYPEPFVTFFFPSCISSSFLSFAIRDPQQFAATFVWGTIQFCFLFNSLWAALVSGFFWVPGVSRSEQVTFWAASFWTICILVVSVAIWRWDLCQLPLLYAASESNFRDLSLLLNNAQGDFYDFNKGLFCIAAFTFFFPFVPRVSINFYWRCALRRLFVLFALFFFGGNGVIADLFLVVVSLCCADLWLFIQNVLFFACKYKIQ